jgi:mevalonate kinase
VTGELRLSPRVDDDRLGAALAVLGHLIPNPGFLLEWETTLPFGAGLGASAALSHLLALAAWEAAHPGTSADPVLLAEVTHRLEHCFHGTPSGIDDAVVRLGAPVLLQRPTITVDWPFSKVPQAAHLWQVTLPMALPLVVAHSGERADTREMITRVRARAGRGFVEDSRALFEEFVEALRQGAPAGVGAVLTRAHELLGAAGASTARLDRMVELALTAGARGAKLTGSGGGGCVLALCDESRRAAVAEAWRTASFEVVSP